MVLKVYILLSCALFIVSASAELTDKPRTLIVTPKTRQELGLPLGTILTLDEKTQRYNPPEISDKFNVDDRIKLTWTNDKTRDLFCKVGPDLSWQRITYKYYYHTWCRGNSGNDLCCGNLKCTCNSLVYNCKCV